MAGGAGDANIPLGELDVMVPPVGDLAEAVTLSDNIEEDEERLLDADFGRDLRGDVCEDPVGEFEKRLLVHVGKVDEALRDCEHERHGSACTGGLYAVHYFGWGLNEGAGRVRLASCGVEWPKRMIVMCS